MDDLGIGRNLLCIVGCVLNVLAYGRVCFGTIICRISVLVQKLRDNRDINKSINNDIRDP